MLVLSRKIGESVIIGDDIYCTVVGFRDDEIRLAFDAPKSISIHRDEIQYLIHEARRSNVGIKEFEVSKESIVDRLIKKFKRPQVNANLMHMSKG